MDLLAFDLSPGRLARLSGTVLYAAGAALTGALLARARSRRIDARRPFDSTRWAVRETATALRFIWLHPANRGRRVRTTLEAVLRQAKVRILGKPSLARLGERSRIWVYADDDPVSWKARYANPPDWPEMLVWARSLRQGDLFVDGGAQIGIYSIWAAERGADVLAVEPNHAYTERLRANIALNGYSVEVVEAALAASPGTVRMTTGLGPSNHLVLGEAPPTLRWRVVRAVTLDDLIGERVAAGLKLDVEGAEAIVIAGAADALREQRIRLIQLEWNDRSLVNIGEERSVVAARLASFGYELLRPDRAGNLVPVEDPPVGEPDVFARPGSWKR